MAKQTSHKIQRMLLVGVVFYLVAWFVPPYKQTTLIAPMAGPDHLPFGNVANSVVEATAEAPDWLPGWAAAKASFMLLVDQPELADDKQPVRRMLGATSLTNLGMLAALFLLLTRQTPRWFGAVLLVCTAVNASWLFLLEGNPFSFLRAGYFLWLLSFPLVGIGIVAQPAGKPGKK